MCSQTARIQVFLFSLMCLCTGLSYSEEYKIIPITNNELRDINPNINNNGSVVWQQYDSFSDSDIMYYNANNVSRITDDTFPNLVPLINDNETIVWFGRNGLGKIFIRREGANNEILFDGVSAFFSITAINNHDHVVWKNGNDLLYYDVEKISKIFDSGIGNIEYININDNNTIAWKSGNGASDDVYLFLNNVVSNVGNQTRYTRDTKPKLNNNDNLVWAENFGPFRGVTYFDGTTSTYTSINDDPVFGLPDINDRDQYVWSAGQGADTEIYFYDGSTVLQITNNSYADINPTINDEGVITWHGGPTPFHQIYVYDGDAIVNISNNDYRNIGPKINNLGHVVWTVNDGNDDEIMLAVPKRAVESIDDLVYYFEQSVIEGALVGIGNGKSSDNKLNAIKNMLLALQTSYATGASKETCNQLRRIAGKSDGEKNPSDFLAGENIDEFYNNIIFVINGLNCL